MRAKPIETFRDGAVGLSVWQREGKAGTYFDFTLSRCYQKENGEYSYSNSFHESNTEALNTVIGEAAKWVTEYRKAAGIPATPRTDDHPQQQEAHE
jgi:hypothetical protein